MGVDPGLGYLATLPIEFVDEMFFKFGQLFAVNSCRVGLQELVSLFSNDSVHLEEVGAFHLVLGWAEAPVEVLNDYFADVVPLLDLLVLVSAEEEGATVGATQF